MNNKILLRIVAIAALIGVADTVYLVSDYYFGSGIQCIITEGCEIVLTSNYSRILGVPLAIFGLVFYVGIFTLINLVDIYQEKIYLKLLLILSGLGFTASLFFLYLQLFVLKALCFYCLISLITSTLIFLSDVVLYKESNHGIT